MKIAKPAIGVLQLLRARPDGETPNNFGRDLLLVCDIRDHYAADLLLGTNSANSVGALINLIDTTTFTTALRIRSINAQLIVGAAPVTAGGFIEWGFIFPNTGGLNVAQGAFSFGVAAATQIVGAGCPVDIVVPAGTAVYARCGGTAAGADHAVSAMATIENYTLT